MSDMRFTKDHEWIRVADDIGTVGITDYAQSQLGDVVYVELPQVGRQMAAGEEAAVVESVKAASEVYTPASGTVTEANARLTDQPMLVNQSAEDQAWFYKLRLTDPGQLGTLMDRGQYEAWIATL